MLQTGHMIYDKRAGRKFEKKESVQIRSSSQLATTIQNTKQSCAALNKKIEKYLNSL
jgi:hypothetical protein